MNTYRLEFKKLYSSVTLWVLIILFLIFDIFLVISSSGDNYTDFIGKVSHETGYVLNGSFYNKLSQINVNNTQSDYLEQFKLDTYQVEDVFDDYDISDVGEKYIAAADAPEKFAEIMRNKYSHSLFLMSDITLFKNGHSKIEEIEYAMGMTKLYGRKVTDEEFANFISERGKTLISETEGYINTFPVFSEVGIYNYEDFEKVYSKSEPTERESEAIWTLLGEESDFVRFKIQALDLFEDRYYGYPEYTLDKALNSEDASTTELVRLLQIKETEEYRSIMDVYSFENTVSYLIYLAILTILITLILVSPLIVNDRSSNIHLLQYSCKNGRRILSQQLISVIISAFMVTTLSVLIFGTIYTINDTFVFWNNGLTSFLNVAVDFFWFDLTYGQYIIFYVLLLYILNIGSAALAFVISRFSQNLISLIMKLIPIFGVLCFISFLLFEKTFSNVNLIYEFTGIRFMEPIVSLLVLLIGLASSIYILYKERKIDVL